MGRFHQTYFPRVSEPKCSCRQLSTQSETHCWCAGTHFWSLWAGSELGDVSWAMQSCTGTADLLGASEEKSNVRELCPE